MIKNIFWDLDGTLLPMDQDNFTKAYFKCLAVKMEPYGYEPKKLIDGIWAGTAAMVKNDGSCTNEEAFWKCAAGIFGDRVLRDRPLFDEFYRVEFQQAAKACGYNPQARQTVEELNRRGFRQILATNPIFPGVATESRIRWAGLDPDDFEHYTTYENTGFCKPNPAYYQDLLERLGCRPEESLMVGNDVDEDMIASGAVGMKVFLLTDCLLNRKNTDISIFARGSFDDLLQYLEQKTAE